MSYWLKVIILCLSSTLLSASNSSAQSEDTTSNQSASKGYEIAQMLDERDAGYGSSTVDLVMTLVNSSGAESERHLNMKFLENTTDGDKTLVELTFPANVRGIKLLTHPKVGADNQWLYLPSQRRIKRIASRSKSGAFMGSEFSFEDLADKQLEDYSYEYIQQEICPSTIETHQSDLHCDVIDRFPQDTSSGYTKQRLWVSNQDQKIFKIEYYDRKKELLKVFEATGFKQFQGKYWRPMTVKMNNVQTKNATVLTYNAFEFDVDLQAQDFRHTLLNQVSR